MKIKNLFFENKILLQSILYFNEIINLLHFIIRLKVVINIKRLNNTYQFI